MLHVRNRGQLSELLLRDFLVDIEITCIDSVFEFEELAEVDLGILHSLYQIKFVACHI